MNSPRAPFSTRVIRRLALAAFAAIRWLDGMAISRPRVALLRLAGATIGKNVHIGSFTFFQEPWNLAIGSRVSIHEFSFISAAGGLEIGSDVSIAHGTSILTTTHIYDVQGTPIRDSGIDHAAVQIADDVWIGCGVRILAGSTIGEGVVVAANSVVKGNLPRNTICVGAPASPRRSRFKNDGK